MLVTIAATSFWLASGALFFGTSTCVGLGVHDGEMAVAAAGSAGGARGRTHQDRMRGFAGRFFPEFDVGGDSTLPSATPNVFVTPALDVLG